jgi:hypothetical protein
MLPIAGFLSVQNASVVCEALDELGSFLVAAQNTPLSENISLNSENIYDAHELYLKDIKDRQKRHRMSIKDSGSTSILSNKGTTGSTHEFDVRKQNIRAILQSGQSLGIRDIAASLPEYSEKMIQRELAEMVVAGKVKKTGLKRWSRYSIVQ